MPDAERPQTDAQRKPIQLDIYLPDLALGIEYAGRGHFEDFLSVASLDKQQATDAAKAAFCLQRGITLLEIPHWWDGTQHSLRDVILSARPDLTSLLTVNLNAK